MLILFIIFGSLVGSFLCSLFEAALYSVTPAKVEHLRRQQVPGAQKLASLRQRIDEPIAAILTVNTIAHTMGAVWAGALVEIRYGETWVTAFSIAFTLAILFITEIIPKTMGVVHAGRLAPAVAWPIQAMIWAVWPLAWLSVRLTERLTRRVKPGGPTEDEIIVMADLASQAGKLLPEEHQWVKNALRLNNVPTRELVKPRHLVETVLADMALEELLERPAPRHSRLPVVEKEDGLDSLVGIVTRRDLYDALARDEHHKRVRDLMSPALHLPATLPANRALNRMLREKKQIAVVVDEHGDVRGIVTLEDILEKLLGQPITDEYDEETKSKA